MGARLNEHRHRWHRFGGLSSRPVGVEVPEEPIGQLARLGRGACGEYRIDVELGSPGVRLQLTDVERVCCGAVSKNRVRRGEDFRAVPP